MTITEEGRKFFMVWRKGGNQPIVQHPDYSSAYIEAQRLAGIETGIPFYVLEAIVGAKSEPNIKTWNLIKETKRKQNGSLLSRSLRT